MKTSSLDIYDEAQSTIFRLCQIILPLVFGSLRRCHGKKLFNVSLRALSNWLEPDGLWGFNSLCGSIYTTALLYPIDSWASVWSSSVGDMTTPWSGLCDNRLTQHWAARLSRICSDQLCNDGSIILLIHVHSIKSYIALISEKRQSAIWRFTGTLARVRHKTFWLMFLWQCFQH